MKEENRLTAFGLGVGSTLGGSKSQFMRKRLVLISGILAALSAFLLTARNILVTSKPADTTGGMVELVKKPLKRLAVSYPRPPLIGLQRTVCAIRDFIPRHCARPRERH